MSDHEDSDSSGDEDYAPSDGCDVSEEEGSEVEENTECLLSEAGEPPTVVKRVKGKKRRRVQDPLSRKRRGGITLEGVDDRVQEDTANEELVTQIAVEIEEKKVEKEKKRADDLWSSFLTDVRKTPNIQPSRTASVSYSSDKAQERLDPPLSTFSKDSSSKTDLQESKTITVTQVFDFAGEEVVISKEVSVNSKEAQDERRKLENQKSEISMLPSVSSSLASRLSSGSTLGALGKRPSGVGSSGLSGLLNKIGKKPKMSTLTKSKMDWDSFKKEENIDDELKIHNRGKESYIERMAFLSRADHRQFEIEKELRLSASSKR